MTSGEARLAVSAGATSMDAHEFKALINHLLDRIEELEHYSDKVARQAAMRGSPYDLSRQRR